MFRALHETKLGVRCLRPKAGGSALVERKGGTKLARWRLR